MALEPSSVASESEQISFPFYAGFLVALFVTLSKYVSHTIQSFHLQFNRFSYIYRVVQPLLQSSFVAFSTPQEETVFLSTVAPILTPCLPLASTHLLSVSGLASCSHFM